VSASTVKTRLARAFVLTSALGATAAGLAAASAPLAACAATPDDQRLTVVIQPDYDAYKTYVDRYLNRRCGTLDCHGQPGRAYRMYGREGFRLYTVEDGGLISGVQPTTEQESLANFQAIVGLEPEEMSRTMALVNDPQRQEDEGIKRLIFIRKPLRLERHKGGPSMADDDPGYRCVRAWLQIPTVRPDGTPIPPDQRPKMSDRARAYCTEAESFP
jgi:hypothetical protein